MLDSCAVPRRVLVEWLQAWGLDADEAADPEQALALLRKGEEEQRPYQVLLAAVPSAHADPAIWAESLLSRTQLPVILLTPFHAALEGLLRQGLGDFRCLTKPAKRRELFDVLLTAISETAVALGRGPPHDPPRPAAEKPQHTILVAEDNAVNRLYIDEGLRAGGYASHVVADGMQAVNAVRERWYDLILMDCQMPHLDGLEAVSRIRHLESSFPERRRTVIVALTANATERDRDRCLQAGMDDFLSKPFSLDDLLGLIRRHLPQVRGPGEGHRAAGTAAAAADDSDEGDEPPVDFPSLIHRCLGNVEFVESLLEAFISSSGDVPARLADCLEQGNLLSLAERAHSLKGAAGIISAARIQELARKLEAHSRHGDLRNCPDLLQRLQGEMKRCTRHIEQWQAKRAAGVGRTG